MTTTTTEAEFTEITDASDHEQERDTISQKHARALLGLGGRQTIRVLDEAGIRGFKVAGKGNKNWYYEDEIRALAARRGAGTGANPQAYEKAAAQGGLAISQRQAKALNSTNTELMKRNEQLATKVGELSTKAAVADELRNERNTLRTNLEAAEKAISSQSARIIQLETMEVAKKVIKKYEKVFLAVALAVVFGLGALTTPLFKAVVNQFIAIIGAN